MGKRSFTLLVINPGSTSTKVAVFCDEDVRFSETIEHTREDLQPFDRIVDQYPMRLDHIEKTLSRIDGGALVFDAVVGRGGLLRPIPGGTYVVDQAMLDDLWGSRFGEHASNLGAILAHAFAKKRGIPAFIVDPVVVDELDEVARISGIPEIQRRSIFHALNQRAVARRACREMGIPYTEARLIVVHLGGGISVGCHREGRVVDVNNALDGEGPFSPERAGTIPAGQLVDLCFSGSFTQKKIRKKLTGEGGCVAHLGTHDLREIRRRIASGDAYADLVYRAMVYQIKKAVGGAACALDGRVDAILLTGGLAHDGELIDELRRGIVWIAPVRVYPGEEEMVALAQGALRVLKGEEAARGYGSESMAPHESGVYE